MFRQTKCARAARRLPLFVTSDLTRRQGRFVAAHIKTCESCRQLVAEFQASRSWLQQGAQVEFADEFYEGIRSAVLSQIAAQRPRARQLPPAFFFVPQLNRSLAFAASVALLCLFAALAHQLAVRRKAKQPGVQAIHSQQHPTPAASLLPKTSPDGGSLAGQNPQPKLRDPIPPQRRANQFTHNGSRTTSLRSTAPRSQPSSLKDRTASPSLVLQKQPDAAPVAHTAAMEEVSRIEMQTADPNIRIIWLTPKADDSSPTKIIENR